MSCCHLDVGAIYIHLMTKYQVVARVRQPGFKVEIQASDGTRSTMLGFVTEEEANIWVTENQRMDTLRFGSTAD